jgi:hypothetical protein
LNFGPLAKTPEFHLWGDQNTRFISCSLLFVIYMVIVLLLNTQILLIEYRSTLDSIHVHICTIVSIMFVFVCVCVYLPCLHLAGPLSQQHAIRIAAIRITVSSIGQLLYQLLCSIMLSVYLYMPISLLRSDSCQN